MDACPVSSIFPRSKAVTLAELIITTLIVSFVLGGVFAADLALRRMDKNASSDTRIMLQVRALAEVIRSSARRVHGDLEDTGFYISKPDKTFCFRYDVGVGTPVQATPEIYTDDNWDCYTQINTDFYRCFFSTQPASPSKCTATDGSFVGGAVTDQFANAAITLPAVIATAAGDFYFQMTLVNRLDLADSADVVAEKLTTGTVANPQVVLQIKENAAGF